MSSLAGVFRRSLRGLGVGLGAANGRGLLRGQYEGAR